MIGAVSMALAFTTECPAEFLSQYVVIATVDDIVAAQEAAREGLKRAAN